MRTTTAAGEAEDAADITPGASGRSAIEGDPPHLAEASPFALPAHGSPGIAAARWALMRDLRRVWLSAASKGSAHALLLARLSPARPTPGLRDKDDAAGDALHRALKECGEVYRVDGGFYAVLLTGRPLREAKRIGETIADAFVERNRRCGSAPHPRFSAGLAALHRDDDPQRTIQIATMALAVAELAAHPNVVCERDLASWGHVGIGGRRVWTAATPAGATAHAPTAAI